jgi:endonuclease YncB( thermonuclease family)
MKPMIKFEQLFFFPADVVSVYDGDTITTQIKLPFNLSKLSKVRLAKIDTPEISTRNKVEKVLGYKAKDRMIELCGDKVWLESLEGGKEDKYGRVLANLYTLDGIDIAETLINEHLGVAYDGGTKKHVWG